MRFLSRIGLVLSLAAINPPAAAGQAVPPGEEGALAAILPPREGDRICYKRVYSPAHLAKHPMQTITEVEFRLAYYRHASDDFYPEGQRNYYFAMLARHRGSDAVLTAFGEFAPAGAGISCGIDDDGGGVRITKRAARELLVSLVEFGRLRMSEGFGDAGGIVLEPGEDDHAFLVTRIDDSVCPPYADW